MRRRRRAIRRVRRRRRRIRRRRVLLVGGMVAFGARKMSARDAQRIEEHTGIPPEELEDEDLDAAMDELGIAKESVTAADQEEGGGGEPAAPGGGGGDLDELEKLADLHAQGILTDEEFAAKKKQILGL